MDFLNNAETKAKAIAIAKTVGIALVSATAGYFAGAALERRKAQPCTVEVVETDAVE